MTSTSWRRTAKAALRSVGFDVIRFHPESSDGAKVVAVFKHLEIDLVLDVGANEGQYGGLLRESGYSGRIVSFEPLSSAYTKLTAAASQHRDWAVHERAAIGDHDGEIAINISGNNVSSSILPILDQCVDAAPAARYVGAETVPLRRLDSVVPAHIGNARSVFLKVDTQGYEAAVLRGASQTLQACKAVQLELSLVPLYEGQELWSYFLAELQAQGFQVWTILPGFVEESTGRTLQLAAIFVRT